MITENGALAQELDGWIAWLDDHTDPSMPIEEWGPRFIPMETWLTMVHADGYKPSR